MDFDFDFALGWGYANNYLTISGSRIIVEQPSTRKSRGRLIGMT